VSEALGFRYESLTPQIVRQYRLEAGGEGILITHVDQSSDAFQDADIRKGQIILEADRKPVKDAKDFEEIYAKIKPGESFLIKVQQAGSEQTFLTALVKPEKAS